MILHSLQQNSYGQLFASKNISKSLKSDISLSKISSDFQGSRFKEILQAFDIKSTVQKSTPTIITVNNKDKMKEVVYSQEKNSMQEQKAVNTENETKEAVSKKAVQKENKVLEKKQVKKDEEDARLGEEAKETNKTEKKIALDTNTVVVHGLNEKSNMKSKSKIHAVSNKEQGKQELNIQVPVEDEGKVLEKGEKLKTKTAVKKETVLQSQTDSTVSESEQLNLVLQASEQSGKIKNKKNTKKEALQSKAENLNSETKNMFEHLHQSRQAFLQKENGNRYKGRKQSIEKVSLNSKQDTNTVLQTQDFSSTIQSQGIFAKGLSKNLVREAQSQVQRFHSNDFVKQVRFFMNGTANGEIKLELQPRELGDLKYHIKIEKNKISAKISVENNLAKDAVLKNLNQLSKQLTQEGFEIGDFTVSVDSNNSENKSKEHELKSRLENSIEFVDRAIELFEHSYIGVSDKINVLA